MSSEHRFVYVTASSREEAHALGRRLVEQRLAACANVIDGMTSVYWWQGAIEEGSEAVLILKTRADRMEQLIAAVKERHTYSCPAVVGLPILEANPAYLSWIDDALAGR